MDGLPPDRLALLPADARIAEAAHRAATATLRAFRGVPPAVREELAQEAALRTWLAEDVRCPERLAAIVSRRLAIDWLRRLRARREVADVDATLAPEPVPWQRRIDARAELAELVGIVERAPALHRDTLELVWARDLDVEELVSVRGDPTGDRAVERDRMYKRRARAVSWLRREAGAGGKPAPPVGLGAPRAACRRAGGARGPG